MKKIAIIVGLTLSIGASAQTVFYGGDWDRLGNLTAQIHSSGMLDSVIYDDFTLTSMSDINGIFANFLDDSGTSTSNKLYWEIRSGMSTGNGGTIVHAGTVSNATVTETGRFNFTTPERKYESVVSTFSLGPGTYFLGVAADSMFEQVFLTTASGANGVGGPLHNGNSFWNMPGAGENFSSVSDFFGGRQTDFSIGIRGATSVPEPTAILGLAIGLVVLVRFRKRS